MPIQDITKFAGKDGVFRRQVSAFRNWISREPNAKFSPEKNRYHLYISHACPWANRVAIVRNLKGLNEIIPVSIVHWHMTQDGWHFENSDGATEEPLYGFKFIKELYFKADGNYEGRFSVPVLWDKKLETIVNNESSEILRMLSHEFDDLIADEYKALDLLPADLEKEIDELNAWVYDGVNNGVYKAGFATTQEAYDGAVTELFAAIDKLESILSKGPYLFGDSLTEADIRLFTTMIRFDVVYVQHFKCNIGMIRFNYPNIHKWMKNLYWNVPGFKETIDFDHIKKHYTKSHTQINPYGITPKGPVPFVMEY